MTLKKANTLRLIYGLCLSLLTVVIGILFLTQVVNIYNSGPQKPFTREIVAEHLSKIAVPCIIWIVAVIAGGVLWSVLPQQKKKLYNSSPVAVYSALSARIPESATGCEKEYMLVNRRKRALIVARVICAAVSAVAVVMCALYLFTLSNLTEFNAQTFEHGIIGALANLFNAENFDADPTRGVIAMTAQLLPWLGACLLCFIGLCVFEWITAKNTLPAVKALVAAGAKQGTAPKSKQKKQVKEHNVAIWAVRIALVAVALAFVVVGAINGGAYDVFIKAINICTECIGLG